MIRTFAEEWYDHFEKEYHKTPFPGGIHKWREWTIKTLSLIERMGNNLGYDVSREKPVRIDMSWKKKYLESQVAIEYETYKKGIFDSELLNLASSNARLKILITYIKDEETDWYVKEIARRWKTRSKRVWNDELLIIFWYLSHGKSKPYF